MPWIRFVLIGLMNLGAGISALVSLVAFIDWLADGFTLFTEAGEYAVTFGLAALVLYVLVFVVSVSTVSSFDKWG